MTTAFSGPAFTEAMPVPSDSMSARVADAVVPLVGGSTPSGRRAGSARRTTFVSRPADRVLARAATACLAVGTLVLGAGVLSLF